MLQGGMSLAFDCKSLDKKVTLIIDAATTLQSNLGSAAAVAPNLALLGAERTPRGSTPESGAREVNKLLKKVAEELAARNPANNSGRSLANRLTNAFSNQEKRMQTNKAERERLILRTTQLRAQLA